MPDPADVNLAKMDCNAQVRIVRTKTAIYWKASKMTVGEYSTDIFGADCSSHRRT